MQAQPQVERVIYNGRMKKRILWTTAALLTAVGIPLSSYAEPNHAVNPSKDNKQAISPQTLPAAQQQNVVKVGEYQSPAGNQAAPVVARIKPHEMAGRQAATLYVRNIPVLTFLAASPVATSSQKDGSTNEDKVATNSSQIKVATKENLPVSTQASFGTNDLQAKNAPVWRATAVAAKLNQMSLDNVDAAKVTVSWKGGDNSAAKAEERYSIKVNDEELVEINAETRLPDQTKSLAEDALQVTNRLRRQLGSASPLREIAGMPKPQLPKPPQKIASSVRARLSGMASWYGPGFHGNRTASGEVYNQHALTAAHRSLPFGTRVRVTNTRTGRSVVVRITDRGPFIRGRVLDLSAAAARMLGVVQAGVAPVQLEVLN